MVFSFFSFFIISFDLLRHFNIYSLHQILQNYCSFCLIIHKWKFQIIMHSLGVVDCVAILFQLMRKEKMTIKEFCEYYESLTIYHIDDIVVSWRYVSFKSLAVSHINGRSRFVGLPSFWWFFRLVTILFNKNLWVFKFLVSSWIGNIYMSLRFVSFPSLQVLKTINYSKLITRHNYLNLIQN